MITMARPASSTLRLALIVALLLSVSLSAYLGTSFSQGANNRNVSVDTRVNVTQSRPEIINMTITTSNVTLNAGARSFFECNVSVRDYNGGSTVAGANATLFQNATGINASSPDDNNTHYTNSTCVVTATGGIFRNFTCSFGILYYANVGPWYCNVTARDDYNFTDSEVNITHIDQLLALNVTTLIDYGNLAVGDTSNPQEANVTNLGNVNINVSVKGYGLTLDDGLSFVCDYGNIGVEHQKYNLTAGGQVLTHYVNLSSSLSQIPGLTVNQQTIDSTQVVNASYWLLYVPPNPFGQCNGTVIFQAERSV